MRNFTNLFLVVLIGLHWSARAQTVTFTCPTTTTTWTVPAGVTSIQVDLSGATGGRNAVDATPYAGYTLIHRGGNGARVQATLAVTPGQVLNIYVGGTPPTAVLGTATPGGFNGGGASNLGPATLVIPDMTGGGGGGASDIRIGGTALANRVIVAGGGGGAGGNYFTPPGTAPAGAVINTDRGGDGGGITAEAGSAGPSPGTIGGPGAGAGGTAVGGGAGGGGGAATNGTLGVGGQGRNNTAGGGGGGGYYGGGGGDWDGAGGGSSYTSPTLATAVTHTRGYNSSGCGSVTITIPCTTPTISGTTTVCAGATTTLSGTAAGGTWTSGTSSVATVDPSTGVVSGVTAGTSQITYTVAGGCFTTAVVTVNTLPATGTITGTTTVCPMATTQLSDGVAGGVWTSVSTGVATISATGLVTGVSAGTSVISYAVTSSCGTAAATTVVTVNPLPNPGTITGTTTICPTGSTLLADAIPGGVWTSETTTVATISSTGLVSGVAAGTSTISYSVTNSCGTAVATILVSVNPPNPGTILGPTVICPTGTTQLTDFVGGGVWGSVTPGVATVNATGLVTGVATGTALITYTISNSCGTAAASIAITVEPINAGTITGAAALCASTTIVLSDGVPGGVWSSLPPGVATVSATGAVTGLSAGTSIVTYTVVNGCGTFRATKAVTVNPLPVTGAISGPTTLCMPATISLTAGAPGGVWSSGTTSIATVNTSGVVTGVAAGNTNISYTVTNSCGTAIATSNITILNVQTPTPIGGGNKVCVGETLQLTNTVPGGQWGTTALPIATVDIVTGEVFGISEGVAGITYLIPQCSYPWVAKNVTVYPIPPTPVIVANGATMTTTLSYTSYQWYLGGTPIPGATDATYVATANGTYSVMVRNAGDCEAMSADKVIAHVGVDNVNVRDVDVKIYPNPASNLLIISSTEKIDISILGVDGKELITQKDATQTDVSSLVPGLYMVRMYDQDGHLVKVATFVKG